MPPPTPLAIATSSLTRLVREESSYASELASQISRTEKLATSLKNGDDEDGDADGNGEWRLRQEVWIPLPFFEFFFEWGFFWVAGRLGV